MVRCSDGSLYTGITKEWFGVLTAVFTPALQRMWNPAYPSIMQGAGLNTRGPGGRLNLSIVKQSPTVGLLCGESVRSSGCGLLRKEN